MKRRHRRFLGLLTLLRPNNNNRLSKLLIRYKKSVSVSPAGASKVSDMPPASRGCASAAAEKARRLFRTAIFMVAMVLSLIASCLPVAIVAAADVSVPFILISAVLPGGIKRHVVNYSFSSSLLDFPLVSVLRSLIVICVYAVCDGPAMSSWPYLGAVSICSMVSVVFLSVKACVFTMEMEAEATTSFSSYSYTPFSIVSREKLHLKKTWGMPVLFMSSVVFALAHIVVAYRNSCHARRKLFFHQAILCKNVFSGYQKVPRSPIPTAGRMLKCDSEMKSKPSGVACDDTELPARLLADIDSLFIACEGLNMHYKLCSPSFPPHRSLSTTAFLEAGPSTALGQSEFERQPSCLLLKMQKHNLHRSYSNQFHGSSLYAPLLDGCPISPVLSEDMPILTLDDPNEEDEVYKSSCESPLKLDAEEHYQFGIVLVHGFGGGVFSWRHVMGELAQQVGCGVVAFDRPGWGLTSRPRRKDWEGKELPNPYTLDSQVGLLLAFCSKMGFSSVVLVAHDDGGLLALKAVQKVQEAANPSSVTIRGVVLLNVSLSREVVPAFARILLRTSLGKKHLVRPLLRTEIIQVVNRRAWYDSTKLTTEVLKHYKAPLCVEGWDEAVHEIGKLSCETVLSPHISASLLNAVEQVPVLVIAGAEDALVPFKSSHAMASKLVNSRLVAISECGHLPHEECPKALLAAMTPFISRVLQELDLENH